MASGRRIKVSHENKRNIEKSIQESEARFKRNHKEQRRRNVGLENRMSEKELEKMFKDEVKKAGGCAYKFVSPGASGVPDRLVVLPDNCIGFVELKAPGKEPRPEQRYQQRRLAALGCYVTVLDDPDSIQQVIHEIQRHNATADNFLHDVLEAGGLI